MQKNRLLLIVTVLALVCSCTKSPAVGPQPDPDPKPVPEPVAGPSVVSCQPYNGSSDVEDRNLSVRISYSADIKCDDHLADSLRIMGPAKLNGVSYAGKHLFIDLNDLVPGTSYVIYIPKGGVRGLDGSLCREYVYRVTIKPIIPVPESVVLNPSPVLTNPNATPEAVNVYNFLLSQSGKKILSGVQASGPGNNDTNADVVFRISGKYPALVGFDFMFLHYSPTPRDWSWVVDFSDISRIKGHWDNNGLVNYMWHWKVPSTHEGWEKGLNDYDFSEYAFYCKETSFSIENALTEGTWENELIIRDMDRVAGYLKILQDNNIPVIWRPLHEAAGNYDIYGGNGAWFWWGKGGPELCRRLYRMMRDKFEKEYGLNNLIWVWTHVTTKGAEDQWSAWYPGNDVVDIIGVDIYSGDTGSKNFEYEAAVNLTGGKKLVTISECGNMPDPLSLFEARNKWNWFMTWGVNQQDYPKNTFEYWRTVMNRECVITRETMPSLK